MYIKTNMEGWCTMQYRRAQQLAGRDARALTFVQKL